MSDDGVGYCPDCTEHLSDSGEWKHPTMSEEQFERRTAQLLREEADNPLDWYYLSFATADSFLGGLYIRAMGTMSALLAANMRGLNPGGEVLCWGPIDEETMAANVPEELRNRLLTKEEVDG